MNHQSESIGYGIGLVGKVGRGMCYDKKYSILFFNFGDQNHNYSKFQELKILFKIINDFFSFQKLKVIK